MTTRLGVQNTIIYDVAKIHERYALRPDQMLDYKAVKGDSTDNIPGVPGIGEKTAAKLIGQFESLEGAVRASRRGDPAQAAGAAGGGERARLPQPRPDADRARPAGGAGPRRGHARRLRPGGGHPAVPRVRVPDADRPAARAGRRVPRGGAGGAARGARERLDPRRAGRRRGAAGGLGDPERGRRRRGPPATGAGTGRGLQLAMDFDAVAEGPAGEQQTVDRPTTVRGPGEAPGDPRSALAAAIADPGLVEVVGEDGVDDLADWIAAQPEVGVAIVLTDPRPLRGEPLALAVAAPTAGPWRPTDPSPSTRLRGSSRRSTRRSSATRSSTCSWPGSRTIVRRRRRAWRSTPRSARTSSMPRCAARPSPTSSRSGST